MNKFCVLKHKKNLALFMAFALSAIFVPAAFSQASKILAVQKLEWQSAGSSLEYTVEVKNLLTGEVESFVTENTFIEVSKAPGKYAFRVKSTDILGREGSVSEWQNFRITKAMTPVIRNVPKKGFTVPEEAEALGENGTFELPMEIRNVSSRTVVELTNPATNEVIAGSLILKQLADGTMIAEGIKVPVLADGSWNIIIRDASGKTAQLSQVKISNPWAEIRLQKAIAEEKEKEELLQKEAEEREAQLKKDAEELEAKQKQEAEELAERQRREAEEEAARRAEQERLEQLEYEKNQQAELLRQQEEEEKRLRKTASGQLELEKQLTFDVKNFSKNGRKKQKVKNHFSLDFAIDSTVALYDSGFFENSLVPLMTEIKGGLTYILPVSLLNNSLQFGLSGAFGCIFLGEPSDNSFSANMVNPFSNAGILNFCMDAAVWYKIPASALGAGLKGGAGAVVYNKKTLGLSESDSWDGSFCIDTGLSLMIIPVKFFKIELFTEYRHLFVTDMQSGLLSLGLAAGVMF